jgi:hypothetical protein
MKKNLIHDERAMAQKRKIGSEACIYIVIRNIIAGNNVYGTKNNGKIQ